MADKQKNKRQDEELTPEELEIRKRSEKFRSQYAPAGEEIPEEAPLESASITGIAGPFKKAALEKAERAGMPALATSAADLLVPEDLEDLLFPAARALKKGAKVMKAVHYFPSDTKKGEKLEEVTERTLDYSKFPKKNKGPGDSGYTLTYGGHNKAPTATKERESTAPSALEAIRKREDERKIAEEIRRKQAEKNFKLEPGEMESIKELIRARSKDLKKE